MQYPTAVQTSLSANVIFVRFEPSGRLIATAQYRASTLIWDIDCKNVARDVPVTFPDLASFSSRASPAIRSSPFCSPIYLMSKLHDGSRGRGTDRVSFPSPSAPRGIKVRIWPSALPRVLEGGCTPFTKGRRLTKPQDLQVFFKITAEGQDLLILSAPPRLPLPKESSGDTLLLE